MHTPNKERVSYKPRRFWTKSSLRKPLFPACIAKSLDFSVRPTLRALVVDLCHVQRAHGEYEIAPLELDGPVRPDPLPALKNAVVLAGMYDELAGRLAHGHSRSFADKKGHNGGSRPMNA